ncbi:MAG: hypothetical protein II937_02430 [Bacteroidales bacterium]|nr:hypothetical protein [Bacteroidales bacterium]
MTKTFLKVLPLAAAVLLATSCSKDDNNEEVNIENQPKAEKVTIPFSVKVNTGNSISKIAYTEDGNDVSKFNVSFTNEDINTIMHITSDGNIDETDLILVKDDDNFVFKGEITLAEGKTEEDFNNGFDITGSFGEAGTSIVTSTTSLADAMGKCSHQYTSTFSSNAETINLDDNYAYLEMSCSAQQTKFQLTIGNNTADYTPNANKKIWIAVPNGTSVTGNMIKSMTVVGGKVYRADRTDVVDLGPSVSVVWTLENVGNIMSWSAATSGVTTKYGAGKGYRLPTKTELDFLLVNCTYQYVSPDYTFTNAYGSITFTAYGHGSVGNDQNTKVAYYWGNQQNVATCFDVPITVGMSVGTGWSSANSFSARAVRQLN